MHPHVFANSPWSSRCHQARRSPLVRSASLAPGQTRTIPHRKGQLSLPWIPYSLFLDCDHTRGSTPGSLPSSYFLKAVASLLQGRHTLERVLYLLLLLPLLLLLLL